MSATGRGAQRHKDDFYATPPWATRAILEHLKRPSGYILEPAAGTGAITGEMVCVGFAMRSRISQIEIDPDRAGMAGDIAHCIQADFLGRNVWGDRFDLIITNPPYSKALEFAERSLEYEPRELALLLRLNFLGSQKRAAWHKVHPSDVYVLPRRPSFTGKGTDATEYAWFVWGEGRGNRWHIL